MNEIIICKFTDFRIVSLLFVITYLLFFSLILRSLMSGIVALLMALVLLVIAIYSLVSYIRERRHSGLPSKKDKH